MALAARRPRSRSTVRRRGTEHTSPARADRTGQPRVRGVRYHLLRFGDRAAHVESVEIGDPGSARGSLDGATERKRKSETGRYEMRPTTRPGKALLVAAAVCA